MSRVICYICCEQMVRIKTSYEHVYRHHISIPGACWYFSTGATECIIKYGVLFYGDSRGHRFSNCPPAIGSLYTLKYPYPHHTERIFYALPEMSTMYGTR